MFSHDPMSGARGVMAPLDLCFIMENVAFPN